MAFLHHGRTSRRVVGGKQETSQGEFDSGFGRSTTLGICGWSPYFLVRASFFFFFIIIIIIIIFFFFFIIIIVIIIIVITVIIT